MRVAPFVVLLASIAFACGSSADRGKDFTDDSSTAPPPDLGKPAEPPPGDPDGDTCGGATALLSHAPVYMLFIVDGSGSMLDPLVPGGPTGLKWQAAKSALNAFIDDAAARKDYSFAAGLFLFDGTKGVPEFQQSDVPIHYVDAQQKNALESRINGSTPQGGTPLTLSLQGQIPFLEGFVPTQPLKSNGKRVLVLMTDGVPDGGADVQPQVQAQCIGLVGDAQKQGVTTFAVGIGDPASASTTYDEIFLGKLAVAGGAPAPGCTPGWNETSPASQTPCHFQITPGQKTAAQIQSEMLAAIEAIRGAAQSCEFVLEATDPIDPTKVNVVYTDANGKETEVYQNASDGWTYDDPSHPTAVIFHGDICKQLQSESDGQVKIELGCATKVK